MDAFAPPTDVVHHLVAVVAENRLQIPIPLHRVTLDISLPDRLEGDVSEEPVPRFSASTWRFRNGHMQAVSCSRGDSLWPSETRGSKFEGDENRCLSRTLTAFVTFDFGPGPL